VGVSKPDSAVGVAADRRREVSAATISIANRSGSPVDPSENIHTPATCSATVAHSTPTTVETRTGRVNRAREFQRQLELPVGS